MEIVYLKSIDSTHKYLQNFITKNGYKNPLAVVTQNQTNGIGSRDNQWVGNAGNLFFSFVIDKSYIPNDLLPQSYSIYFSYLLKEILEKHGSTIWLKWPNDFYIDKSKVGGTITNLKGDLIYCGIGVNLIDVENMYSSLDIKINIETLLKEYFTVIERKKSWKQIFSKFLIEFDKSKVYKTTINDKKVSLDTAVLNSDGSITIDNKKVFSLR
ncbi:MAG: biotin--[acetyl-CoA-carboxylase] ligase [Fusobacteriaceae bacterium]|nr:biotin--[acetyl-CoA-carboxylase] ligase [Fusobacteriaceae bacterium]